jgi:CRP/FNR family transcriptional regulator
VGDLHARRETTTISTSEPTHALIDALSTFAYFSELDRVALSIIADQTYRQEYEAGQIILLEGCACPGLYLVQDGWLKAVKISSVGREYVWHFVGPGDIFPEASLLAEIPNPATVIALEPTTLFLIEAAVIYQLLVDYPHLFRAGLQRLANSVTDLVNTVANLALHPIEARLARLLLEQSTEGVYRRQPWATQAELAAHLGTVGDVLGRALRKLVEAGFIEMDRREIRILDPQRLQAEFDLEA